MLDWTAAYQEHGSLVLRYLARRLPREDAEDLAHETFVRAMRSPDGIRDEAKVRPYLMRTAHNLLLNFRRRKKLVRSEHELADGASLEVIAGGRPEQASSAVAMRELGEQIEAVLRELPRDQQLAFRWGVLERWTYREICGRTGWSLSKVKIDVYRARKMLMQRLAHAHRDGENRDATLRSP